MSLITKYVSIRWHNKNKQWYINKGYKFTKNKNSFEVKVEDLSNGCREKVDIQCDGCGVELKSIDWQNYKVTVRENGKYYCNNCAKNGDSKWISFEQWCIENNRQDVLNRWDYELNLCKPSEVTHSTNKKYYFKCPINLHESELKIINAFTRGQIGSMDCKGCNSFAQWGIDNICLDFLEKYWDYKKNIISPWRIDKSCKIKVWIKCQGKEYHGSYDVTCNSFNRQGNRCPFCTNKNGKVHYLDSLGTLYPEVIKYWSNKNKKSPFEYAPKSNQKVWWKCLEGKHEDCFRYIRHSTNCNFRCPECSRERNESFLQEKVRLYLNELNYTVLHERNCNIVAQNPKVKSKTGRMPYDNEVVELNLIIEVHGEQHFKVSYYPTLTAKNNNTTPEYELHKIRLHDRYKRIFAKKRGYFYLEIPYWTDDKKELWKKLIDDKIKKIMNKEG
jgi:hypothetical protein